MTPVEIAWAAGLFEGEGTVTRHKAGAKPYLAVQMTDELPVRRFAEIADVAVYGPFVQREGAKPFWRAQVYGAKAQALATAILPWMSPRRSEKLVELIEWTDRKPGRKSL